MAEEYFETPSDSLDIVESEAKGTGLVKSDSISISETLVNGLEKPLTDSVVLADSEIETPEKALTDSLSVSESLAKEWFANIAPTDNLSIVEQLANLITMVTSGSISFAESISKVAVQLNLTTNQTFAEEVAKNAVLGKTDTLSIAEAVAKAFGLYKDDSESLSESEAWFFNKIITDQITPFADGSVLYDVTLEVWWGAIKWRTACHSGL